ncbi:MAG TPA: hypothetical protein VME23_19315 [Terracidiphilus sp.]|nr:hypothetical protein [Terracidiphilus sp.]
MHEPLVASLVVVAVFLLAIVIVMYVKSSKSVALKDGPTLLHLSSSAEGSVVVPVRSQAAIPEHPGHKFLAKVLQAGEPSEIERQVDEVIDRLILTK